MYILLIKHFFSRPQIVLYYKYIRIASSEGKKFYIFLQIKFKKASEFGDISKRAYMPKSLRAFSLV